MIHEFKINNREFLAIAVPEGTEWYNEQRGEKFIAFYPGMSEEVAAGIVEKVPIESIPERTAYRSYEDKGDSTQWFVNSACRSFASIMIAERIYLVNPFQEPKSGMNEDKRVYNQWHEARSRTSKVWAIVEQINKIGK